MKKFSKTVSTVNLVFFVLIATIAVATLLGSLIDKDLRDEFATGFGLLIGSLIQYFIGRCIYHHFLYKELDLEMKSFQDWEQ